MLSIYKNERTSLNSLSFHPEWDQDKADQTLYLSFPTIVIAHAQHPEVFQEVRIVPLESNEQKEKAGNKSLQIADQKDILIYLIHTRSITFSQFQTIEAFFTDRLNNVIPSNSSSEIESLLANLQEKLALLSISIYL